MAINPQHEFAIRRGGRLQAVVTHFFNLFGQQARQAFQLGRIWIPSEQDQKLFQEAVRPFLQAQYAQGAYRFQQALVGHQMRQRLRYPDQALAFKVVNFKNRKPGSIFKSDPDFEIANVQNFNIAFDVFNPEVLEFVREMSLHLVQSTLATLAKRVADAYEITFREAGIDLPGLADLPGIVAQEAVKNELTHALAAGEAHQKISARLGQIFRDPDKALQIAQTERSRAIHAGSQDAAESAGMMTKEWLASSDACPRCLKLDGKIVGIDEPFAVFGTGPYSIVPHPPAHPSCFCTETYSD